MTNEQVARPQKVRPDGWPQPKGYENGMITEGRLLHVGGQVGWTPEGVFEAKDFVGQFEQTLNNVLAVVHAAGADAQSIARMTVYVTDLPAYRSSLKDVGAVWKRTMGKSFPAMALVGVAGLVEPDALVEIEAVAVLPPNDNTGEDS